MELAANTKPLESISYFCTISNMIMAVRASEVKAALETFKFCVVKVTDLQRTGGGLFVKLARLWYVNLQRGRK
jgi:hypothetical protein